MQGYFAFLQIVVTLYSTHGDKRLYERLLRACMIIFQFAKRDNIMKTGTTHPAKLPKEVKG